MFISFFISITETTNIKQSKCNSSPNVVFSSDISSLQDRIIREIESATSEVTLAFFDCNKNLNYFIPSLVYASKNGAKITIIVPYNKKQADVFERYGFKNIIYTDGVEKPFFLQTFVIDDKAFMTPFVSDDGSEDHPMGQMISIDGCTPLTDEIKTFINLYKLKHKGESEPKIYKSNFIAKSSAMFPVKSGNSSFFFINNPGIDYPLKEDTINFLTNSILNNGNYTNELLVYTYSTQLPEETNTEINQFSLYTLFKSLLFHNTTKVRYLVSEKSINDPLNIKYIQSFAAFSKAEFRYYDKKYEGVNFIVNNEDTYIFNHAIQTSEIKNYQSLHLVSDDVEINKYCRNFFDEIWNQSKPYVVEWN